MQGEPMNIDEQSITHEHFADLDKRIRFNDYISAYYTQMYCETDDEIYQHRADSVNLCLKYWDVEYYRMQGVKDIQRVNLCKDKFCFNCQSMLAIKRQVKYTPVLDEYKQTHDIWHIVFTVPNCEGAELRRILVTMYKKFGYMMRYFKGQKKIRGIAFGCYGYLGAVRSLEVTQNCETGEFHPHFHCMFILRKDLEFGGRYINSYSYSYGSKVRYFVDFEILLQKIWYLLMNGKEVTESAIGDLKEGYSVTADCVRDGQYHEVFKYAIKGSFKDGSIYNYDTFKTLYTALHNRRIIQGYGVLHKCTETENEQILGDELESMYLQLIEELIRWEEPVRVCETLDRVLTDSKRSEINYISKSNLKSILRKIKREEVKDQ